MGLLATIGLLVVAIIFLLVVFIILLFQSQEKYFRKQKIPYLGARFKQNMDMIFGKNQSVCDAEGLLYLEAKEKNFPLVGMTDLFGTCNVYITDLDLMRNIYVKDFDHFINRRPIKTTNPKDYISKAIMNMENDAWKGKRALLSPTFTTGKIRKLFQIFQSSSLKLEKYIKSLMGHPEKSSMDVNLAPLFSKYAMDVIASCAFGVDSQTWQFEPEKKSTFEMMANKLGFKMTLSFLLRFMLSATLPRVADLLGISAFDGESQEYFADIIRRVIKHRRDTGSRGEDFLQLMLDSQQGLIKDDEETNQVMNGVDGDTNTNGIGNVNRNKLSFDDDDVIANCATFLSAGFDTTQSAMIFITHALAVHEDVQKKCLEEIQAAMDKHGELGYNAISEMTYLDWVIQETLRYYPPATRTERICNKDYLVPKTNVKIEKGNLVTMPIYGLHRDPVLFPNPDKFIPERFGPENKGTRHPYAFVPFGHGPRNCIGMRFALIKVKAMIAHLVKAFHIEPCSQTKIPIDFDKNFIVKTKSGMWLKLTARN